MEDVNISKYRAQVVRAGSTPASPGFVVSEGQDPVNPSGSSNYVPYSGAISNVDFGEFGLDTGFVTLDTTPTNIPTEQGGIYWDDARSTAALIMNGTLQHIGQDTFFYVKNSTGSSIPKGTAVRFDGTDGASGHLLIAPFLANGTYPSNYFMGVTAEVIANGSFGQVMHFGELTGVNTSGYTAGALLYASTSVAGAFQTTAPVAPNNIVLVAAAINSTNNGTILVRPTYGSNINQDEGVKITSGTTGDLLQLQAGGLWENKTLAQVIGSAYVPSTRTITINGTTQDLSANRTYNVGTVTSVTASSPLFSSGGTTPNITIQQASGSQSGFLSSTDWTTFNSKIAGTIASGQVAFGTAANTVGGNAGLTWDNTTKTLRLKDSTDTYGSNIATVSFNTEISSPGSLFVNVGSNVLRGLQIRRGGENVWNIGGSGNIVSTTAGAGAAASIYAGITGAFGFYSVGSTLASNVIYLNNRVDNNNYGVRLAYRNAGTEATGLALQNNGNVLIGTTTDAGFKLDVNGTGRFSGAVTASGSGSFMQADFFQTGSTPATSGGVRLGTQVAIRARNVANTANIPLIESTASDGVSVSNGALILSSTGAATFSGDVTISKTSPTFRVTRGNTSSSSLVVYNTNGTDDWLIGTGVTGTNSDYRIYNNGLGADAIYIVKSNNNVLIGTTTDAGDKLQVNGAIKTSAPSGGTAGSWKFGTASSGSFSVGGRVRIEINGVAYDLLTT